jgi:6-phosphogluconolactonase
VWLIASGAGKAHAIKLATSGLPAKEAPAGAARGLDRSLVLCDKDAAADVN